MCCVALCCVWKTWKTALAQRPEEETPLKLKLKLQMQTLTFFSSMRCSSNPNTCRHLLTVGLDGLEGVVYLDDADRKMIVTRAGGMRPLLLSDCHVPPDLRFTFYDQVHTTGKLSTYAAVVLFFCENGLSTCFEVQS